MIAVTAIVPAYDAAATLHACVSSLAAQLGQDDEIVVVDDASSDATAEIASSYRVRVIRLAERRGPAAARNAGAATARGAVLLFVDADVVLAPGGLSRVRAAFDDPDLDGLIGSYDDDPPERSTVSLFKNLSHHYFHQRSGGEATTFWGACGAIRREVFVAAGGFDEGRFSLPSIEDVEFGYRLVERGRRIRLDPELRVRHLKRWTFRSLVTTDVARRAIPWTRLALERGHLPATLNFGPGQRVAAAVALALSATASASLVWRPALAPLPILLAAAVWLNRDLYALFASKGGARLAFGGFLLQQLYYLYSLAGAAIGLALHLLAARPARPAPFLLAITVALFGYHVATSLRFVGPGIFDEAGYLGNARNLVDPTIVWKMGDATFYRSAYSLLILPAEFLGPVTSRYRAALAINGLLLASLAPMLYVLTRRLTACTPRAALVGSVVAATLPAVLMWSKIAMAEVLTITGFTGAVGALWLTVSDRPVWQRLAFGPLLALLYGTHDRFLPVVVLGLLMLPVMGWALRSWRICACNVLLAAGGIGGFELLHAHLIALRWESVLRPQGAVTDLTGVLGAVTSGSDLRALLGAIIGQSWYVVATTFGLAAFGLVELLAHVIRGHTGSGEDSSPAPGGRRDEISSPLARLRAALDREPSRLVAAFAFASCLGIFAASWLFLFRFSLFRPDHFVHGRYNETCVPLLVAVGIGALLRGRNRRFVLAGSVLAVLVLAAGLTELVLIRDAHRYTGTQLGWNVVDVFGIYPFVDAEARGPNPDYRTVLQTITFASLAGMLALVMVGLTSRGNRWGAAAFAVLCLSVSIPVGRADLAFFGMYIERLYGNYSLPADLAGMGSPRRIAFEARGMRDLTSWHTYQYSLPDTEVLALRQPTERVPDVPVVIAPFDWRLARELGARLASTETAHGFGVWVMPGKLQDEMAAAGWLVPSDYDGRLPEPARRGSIELLRHSRHLAIESGGSATLKVRVRHLGEGAPWLAGAVPLQGRMAVSAAWRPPVGRPIDLRMGWAGLGELPRTLRPGEEVVVELPIRAADDAGNHLPPGLYRITIELHEVGVSSLTTPETAPVTLSVWVIP